MAVKHVETFTFELEPSVCKADGRGDYVVTLDRAGLTRLYLDLAEALGNDRPAPYEEYVDSGQSFDQPPSETSISIEEALAAMQVQERAMQHTAPPNQPRGSAIGNSHV